MAWFQTTLILLVLSWSPWAYAYLDPGTGSMIISAVIGIVATLALAIKTYWYKLIGLLRKRQPPPANASAGPRDPD